jgi:molybdopterin molybdotransferase
MKKDFFKVITRAEALSLFDTVPKIGSEMIKTRDAQDRIASETVCAECEVPGFDRSVMDGFAVRAEDTFGASESLPIRLLLKGEVVMGKEPAISCQRGEAIGISTGGMIPEGANAVVMVEYTAGDGEYILVKRAVAPQEHIVGRGSDIAKGDVLIASGNKIKPQHIGALAACGVVSVSVYARPRIAILSTGAELVTPEDEPPLAKIRGTNAWSLAALTERYGGEPIALGIAGDTREEIVPCIREGLQIAEMVIISGGSSVGTKDITLDCIQAFENAEVRANGLALKPGKPTILAAIDGKPVIGLPGHPVSCMVIFYLIVRPLMNRMLSYTEANRDRYTVRARLAQNIPSVSGREEYVRVLLNEKRGELWAERIPGGSGVISSLSRSDGLVRIELEREGIEKGAVVDVLIM